MKLKEHFVRKLDKVQVENERHLFQLKCFCSSHLGTNSLEVTASHVHACELLKSSEQNATHKVTYTVQPVLATTAL